MFNEIQIKEFTTSEMKIYQYMIGHETLIPYMSIRDLSDALDISTTSILRFCKKLGYEGFKEFKYAYKKSLKQTEKVFDYDFMEVIECLQKFNGEYYQDLFSKARQIIRNASTVIFFGIGDSGLIGQYAARRFSNADKFSLAVNDPYYKFNFGKENLVLIVLSVSGETPELVREIQHAKRIGCPVISISATAYNTIASLSDLVIPYYANRHYDQYREFTSQIPAVAIIENLAKHLM